MRTTTIRVTDDTHKKLRDLAKTARQPMHELVAQAIKEYEERRFWDDVNAAYARLQADAEAWKEVLEERAMWDIGLQDGLKDFPYESDEDRAVDA